MSNVTKIGRPASGHREVQIHDAVVDCLGELQDRLCRAAGLAHLIAQAAEAQQSAAQEPTGNAASLLAEIIEDISSELDAPALCAAANERMARDAKDAEHDAEGGAA